MSDPIAKAPAMARHTRRKITPGDTRRSRYAAEDLSLEPDPLAGRESVT